MLLSYTDSLASDAQFLPPSSYPKAIRGAYEDLCCQVTRATGIGYKFATGSCGWHESGAFAGQRGNAARPAANWKLKDREPYAVRWLDENRVVWESLPLAPEIETALAIARKAGIAQAMVKATRKPQADTVATVTYKARARF